MWDPPRLRTPARGSYEDKLASLFLGLATLPVDDVVVDQKIST